jgi:hypothetical protein
MDSIQRRHQSQDTDWHPMHCNHEYHKHKETIDGWSTPSVPDESLVPSQSDEAIPRRPSFGRKLRRMSSATFSLLAGIQAKSLKLFRRS